MTGERLLQMIDRSEHAERLRKLAVLIASDPELMAEYGALLVLQKRLVAADAGGACELADRLRTEYAAALDGLSAVPAVSEYLALVDELDDIAQEVAAILNEGIGRI
ncbi:MAG TPA: hypothetical protein DCP62_06230 [Erysipelotrichaceae bacterium]|nr:MAG: hypothetical protein A2Y16_07285 [Tenericutes bacterium GWF2_57_13]HAM63240.1 hypothetical protein [Erysipelotrichaceae bacterium]